MKGSKLHRLEQLAKFAGFLVSEEPHAVPPDGPRSYRSSSAVDVHTLRFELQEATGKTRVETTASQLMPALVLP